MRLTWQLPALTDCQVVTHLKGSMHRGSSYTFPRMHKMSAFESHGASMVQNLRMWTYPFFAVF